MSVGEWARDNPELWLKRVFDADLWDTQTQILRSFRDHKITLVPSCHASGKSFTAAHAALWALCTHKDSKVPTTATVFEQVEKGIWGELRAGFERHRRLAQEGKCPPLGVEPLTTELKISTLTGACGLWWMRGTAYRKSVGTRLYPTYPLAGVTC
jgi:hypothetical protein